MFNWMRKEKIIGALISAVVAVTSLAVPGAFPDACGTVMAAGTQDYKELLADYDMIHFMSPKGGKIDFYFDGANCGVKTDCADSINLAVYDDEYKFIFDEDFRGSFETELASRITQDMMYNITLSYEADGFNIVQEFIYFTKDDSGNLRFIKSPVYDFNLERCSELWTDEQSLKEDLQPQNDVESNDPYVIRTASELTSGLYTDWEKAYVLYKFIVDEFSYDYIQIEDYSMGYQDDARSLIRRKIAICEGMANTYVALCRAAGVPAAVSFGIGMSLGEVFESDKILDDEVSDHAWACVCIDGTWYHVDPTWDCQNSYTGSSFSSGYVARGKGTYDWYLQPLETFSMTHKILDADTIHGIESSGTCGKSATYEISRDGTITIYGSGELKLPQDLNGFRKVVFDKNCEITAILEDCFVDCDMLEEVILPDTVERIDDYAFNTCEDLEYIYLPEGLRSIGDYAFDSCDELAYVYIPSTVTHIGYSAFDYCPRLVINCPLSVADAVKDSFVGPLKVIVRNE